MTQYILTNKEMAKADLLTIESGISSLDLMFNAGKKVFNNLPVQRGKRALFICGPGNNGGDGYVAADLILKQGMEIDIYCPISKAKESNDNLHYKQKLNQSLFVSKIRSLSNETGVAVVSSVREADAFIEAYLNKNLALDDMEVIQDVS